MRVAELFEVVAPEERAQEGALPLTLLVRPWPMLALLVLAVNDHLLKGAGLLPGWVTGKLSDFAGLLVFPLLLVTLYNLFVEGVSGLLRRRFLGASPSTLQLVVACTLTGVVFSAVQIHPSAAELYARSSGWLAFWSSGPPPRVVMDPSDILAVPMVFLAFLLGQRAIARVPPGRLPFVQERLEGIADEVSRHSLAAHVLRDVRAAQRAELRPLVDELARALSEGAPAAEHDALLKRLRGAVPSLRP
jgi:hypothetical protein